MIGRHHDRTAQESHSISGLSKSQVSRLCQEIDERVQAFLTRPIEGSWPYLWLDATYLKARAAGRTDRNSGRKNIVGMWRGRGYVVRVIAANCLCP